MRTLLFVMLTSLPGAATAQSSLGVTGAEFSLGLAEDEAGDQRGQVSATVDVAVTGVHGFQGDLSYADTGTGAIGTVAGHLYMTPRPGQKYGLFAALSDVDGRSMLYGSLGAEGMFSLGENASVEAHAGMGWADTGGLDYVFAGAGLAYAVSPALGLELTVDVADFDEAGFSATSYEAGLRATYSPEGAPWGVYADVTRSGLTGADGGAGATRLGLGVTLTLGTAGGTDPHTRPFRTPDPVAPLVRRGLW